MSKKVFYEYEKKLAREGFTKSLMFGGAIGFTALMIAAAISYFTGFEHIWVSVLIFALVSGVSVPTLYYKKYRPTAKAIAVRLDELGLEERMLTMTELEGDESFMARKQREDAMKVLNTVNTSVLKFAVSATLVICFALAGLSGIGMTTVYAMSLGGELESGKEIIQGLTNPPRDFEIVYEIEGEGMVSLDEQIVREGEDALPVTAEPDDEWMFAGWIVQTLDSEGEVAQKILEENASPYREDKEVKANMVIVAVFQEVTESDEESESDESEADESDETPQDPQESENQPQNGDGSGDDGGGSTGGGRYEENNFVIDGETYYGGETFDSAYEDAMSETSQDSDISDDVGDIIGDYYGTIQK